MWVVFAVLTVLFWGSSDVVFKNVSRKGLADEYKLLALNGIVYGLSCFGFWAVTGTAMSFSAFIKYLPIAAMYLASMLFYYKMLPHIKISIASPIANSSCVLVTLLCVFVLKQTVTPWQAAAILLMVAAIIALTYDKTEQREHAGKKDYLIGIGFAMIYFAFDGAASFFDEYILDDALAAEEVIISYGICYFIVGICALCVSYKKRGKGGYGFKSVLDLKTLSGCLLETGGQFTYVFCYAAGDAAIASPFIASFSMVSVVLSRIFLKEKLTVKQYALVAVIIAGMFVLALEQP